MQAGKTNASGWIYLSEECAYTPAMLSTLFNEPQQMVETALKLFSSRPFQLIELTDDGLIYIPNWEKHQNIEGMDKIREQNRIRKINQRERQKQLMSRDIHVTSQQNHATDIDKELDIDIETKKKDIVRAKRFTPPSLNDVQAYCTERQNGIDAAKWFNHYTANGWKVGKNKMQDWKAAVRTWEQNVKGGSNSAINRGRTENLNAGIDFGF
jgi:predicted phage replisome organizer